MVHMTKPTSLGLLTLLLSAVCLFCAGLSTAFAYEADIASWYPRTVTSDEGTVVIFAPQIEAWRDFDTLTAVVAFRVTRQGTEDAFYGSVRFDAQTDTDLAEREVLLHDEAPPLTFSLQGVQLGSLEFPLASEREVEALDAMEALLRQGRECHVFLTSHLLYGGGNRIITFSCRKPLAIIYKEIGTMRIRLEPSH